MEVTLPWRQKVNNVSKAYQKICTGVSFLLQFLPERSRSKNWDDALRVTKYGGHMPGSDSLPRDRRHTYEIIFSPGILKIARLIRVIDYDYYVEPWYRWDCLDGTTIYEKDWLIAWRKLPRK